MRKITDFVGKDELVKYATTLKRMVKETNAVYAAAIPLIRDKYAGKKLTKRLVNDLQALFPKQVVVHTWDGEYPVPHVNIFLSKEFSSTTRIYISLHDRAYGIENEISNSIYFRNDDEVILPEKVIAEIERDILRNNRLVIEYEDAIKNFEKYQAQYEKAKDAFMKALSKIHQSFVPSSIQTYQLKGTEWEEKIESRLNK